MPDKTPTGTGTNVIPLYTRPAPDRPGRAPNREDEPAPAIFIAECIAAYRRHKQDPTQPFREWIDPSQYSPLTAVDAVADIVTHSAYHALRGHVREIGWYAFARGGTAAMRRLFDQVRALSDGAEPVAILDNWWSGIGSGRRRWEA